MPSDDPGSLKEDCRELLEAWKNGPEKTPGCNWIIPPAEDRKQPQVVGADYPWKADFNRPDKRVLDKLSKKPVRISEPMPRSRK